MPVKTWTGFPDPENPDNDLKQHTFAMLAEKIGWTGTEAELEKALRDQRAEVRRQRTEDRGQRSERIEVGDQRSEVRDQRSESRGQELNRWDRNGS